MHRTIDGDGLVPQNALPGAALGICGEIGELLESNPDTTIFEAGDTLSYVYIMAEVLLLDGSRWIDPMHLNDPSYCHHHYRLAQHSWRWPKTTIDEAIISALRVSELAKKRAIQGRPIRSEAFEPHLRTIVQQLSVYLADRQISIEETLERNVQKLSIRYARSAEIAADEMKLPRLVDHPVPSSFVDPGGPFDAGWAEADRE